MTMNELFKALYEEAERTGGIPEDLDGELQCCRELKEAALILLKYLGAVKVSIYDTKTDNSDGA
ncbi:MAG: hypothetical protein IJL18_04975 [Synergistaceae bacterium]|nr:hypothetical protein [Synergistaceae bacterium]